MVSVKLLKWCNMDKLRTEWVEKLTPIGFIQMVVMNQKLLIRKELF